MMSTRGADLEKSEEGPISPKAKGDDVRAGDGGQQQVRVLPGHQPVLGRGNSTVMNQKPCSGQHWNIQDSFS